MNKLTIAAVPVEMLGIVWPLAAPHIERVIQKAPDEITMDALYKRVTSSNSLLVVICDGKDVIAANILEVRTFDTGIRSLYIPITGGDRLNEWMVDFLTVCKAIAKDYKCTQLRGLAVRKGWMRKLEPLGWEEVHTVIKCEIGE